MFSRISTPALSALFIFTIVAAGALVGLSGRKSVAEEKDASHQSSLTLQGKECDRAGLDLMASKTFNGIFVNHPTRKGQNATMQCEGNNGPTIALFDGRDRPVFGTASNLAFFLDNDGTPFLQLVTSKGEIRLVKVEDMLPPKKK